jgi:hypothetical protein
MFFRRIDEFRASKELSQLVIEGEREPLLARSGVRLEDMVMMEEKMEMEPNRESRFENGS